MVAAVGAAPDSSTATLTCRDDDLNDGTDRSNALDAATGCGLRQPSRAPRPGLADHAHQHVVRLERDRPAAMRNRLDHGRVRRPGVGQVVDMSPKLIA